MNQSKRADSTKSVLSLAAVTLALAGPAFAQTATPAEQQPQVLEEVEVTGSYIPYAADAPAVPVDVINSADIQRSGVSSNVLDIVKKSVPQFSGNSNLGSDNGNVSAGDTNGGSRIALRSRSTLVLVDGRRIAFSPVSASGGYQFVNVNLFPVSAIDSIEILKDGASATYGSDAVSGVVNVKLKTDYEGVEVGGRYAVSDNDGSYTERSYYAIAGGKAKKTSITTTYSYSREDPIYQSERFSELYRTVTFAGIVNIGTSYYRLNPAYNSPTEALAALAPSEGTDLTPARLVELGVYQGPLSSGGVVGYFDLSAKPTLLIANERQGFTTNIKHELSDSVTLFASLIHSNTETFSQLNAQPVSGSVAASNALNPFDSAVTARNRFVDYPRRYISDETLDRGIIGARGSITDRISFEVAGNFNYTTNKYSNENLIDATAYAAAVADGSYNPFAIQQADGVIESFLGTAYGDYSSALYSVDGRLLFDVVELPAGMLKLATGFEHRRETLKYVNDRYSREGLWLNSTPDQPFNAALEVQGYFAEVRAPIVSPEQKIAGLHTLELSAAVRHEVYDTTEDPTVPKYGFRWLPFDEQFAVRGSYSKAFNAPSLFDLYGPATEGYTSALSIDAYNADGTSTGTSTTSAQFRSQGGSNDALDPSKSESWNIGFVYSPKAIKGLSVEVDWFNIDESNLVSTIGSDTILQSVEQYGPASPYANLVRIAESVAGESHFANSDSPGAVITAPGQISTAVPDEVWVSDSKINIAGLQQTGLDVKVSYNFTTESIGSFEVGSSLAWINSFKEKTLPDQDEYNFASSYTQRWGTLPRWTTYSYVDWIFKGFTTSVANKFTPRVNDVDAEYTVEHVSVYDVAVAYDFAETKVRYLDGLTVRVGVNNVFNELTPYVPSESDQSADINYYGAVGRLWYVEGSYKF